jgi:hypothetical protein
VEISLENSLSSKGSRKALSSLSKGSISISRPHPDRKRRHRAKSVRSAVSVTVVATNLIVPITSSRVVINRDSRHRLAATNPVKMKAQAQAHSPARVKAKAKVVNLEAHSLEAVSPARVKAKVEVVSPEAHSPEETLMVRRRCQQIKGKQPMPRAAELVLVVAITLRAQPLPRRCLRGLYRRTRQRSEGTPVKWK